MITCLAMATATACGGGRAESPSARPSSAGPTGAGPTGAAGSGTTAKPSPVATGATTVSREWRSVKGADLEGNSGLVDVAATGPGDAWAVGFKESAEDREGTPALQHWDGTRWTETAVDPSKAWHLVGVSAGGPDDVWIVGNASNAYAAHWDGHRWTGSHPFGVAEDYFLSDVATTQGHAWLVGRGPAQGVITEWREGGFRNALRADGYFTAVTAKQGHVWAVGTDAPAGSDTPGNPMVWHGSAVTGPDVQSWQRGRTPEIPGGVLRRVWMVTPSDVWAVGNVTPPGGAATGGGATAEGGSSDPTGGAAEVPLVLHWDGATWQRVPVPIARGRLDGVTAFAADDIWLTGIDADHSAQVLFLHFDGRKWTPSYGPVLRGKGKGQQYPWADAIARTGVARVPGTTRLWAVGSVGWGDTEDDFVLRHD